ncbi:LPXTG cell wall anchor domain-containing protein [Streptomyces jumonjinensis]|uniref:LPXTG cell wall anchor domain-containing protein n=2 Tax=Streptomyces jumonjinensis TaxID=1945 RepID=A0A646K9R7_STRJU|nr:LPXTG cell wall anchor domain-containing protein [Streptomyces jumonjinensis]
MSAGISQLRKRKGPYAMRRGLLCAAAVAWAVGVVGTAPVAAAVEDVRSRQWYLDAMRAEEIWKTTTGEGIKVAVIDTGINSSTPSLKGQVLEGFDATKARGEATDDYDGHGTTMAELIAGTGQGGGLQGLAPGVKVIPIRISDTEFQEKHKSNLRDKSDAIRAAADSDAQIISISSGSEFYEPKEEEAVKYAEKKGKLIFAAVGNTGDEDNKPGYPASYDEVVGVGASIAAGKVAEYSYHGEAVDLVAPGSGIPHWCDASFKGYCDGNGTSAATAIASASAALIWSTNPDWTANQVLRVMFESAGRGKDGNKKTLSNFYGHGVVRPGAHINRGLGKPGDPDLSPLTNKRTGAATASATPSAPAKSSPAKSAPPADTAVAGSSEKSGDDGWWGLVLGGAGVVVALAGGGFFVARRRRSA